MADKHWVGEPPAVCDICLHHIRDTFIDGATLKGPWASMCPPCHTRYGVGLGLGKGQQYYHTEGKWKKVAG